MTYFSVLSSNIQRAKLSSLSLWCALLLGLLLVGCSSPEDKAERFFEKAEALRTEGRVQEAKIEYRNALSNNNFHIGALMGLARIQEQEQNWQGLYKTLNAVLDIDEKHVDARMTLTELMLAGGELDGAMESTSMLLELSPDNADVMTLRAATLMKLDDREGAIRVANKALELDPAHIDAMILLATEKLRINALAEAAAYIDRALETEPDNLLVNGLKIQLLALQGKIAEAAGVYEHLIRVSESPGPIYKSLANFYIGHNQFDQAEATLRRFAREMPSSEANLAVVSFLYRSKGDAAGDQELQRLMQTQPQEVSFQLFWVDVLLQRNDLQTARKQLGRILQSSATEQESLQAQNRLAVIELTEGNEQEASALIDAVLAVDKQNLTALLARARLQLMQTDIDAAISTLRTGLSFAPKSAKVLHGLARAYDAQGSVELAQEQYQIAITEAPFSQPIVQDYAQFLIKNRKLLQAEELLDAALNQGAVNVTTAELLAQVKLSLGKWQEAEQLAKILDQQGSDKALAASLLGRAYFGMEQFDSGIASLENAQKAAPDAAEHMTALVAGYMNAGQAAKAKTFLEQVISTDPDNHHAHFLMGVMYQMQKQFPLAQRSFDAATRYKPAFVDAYLQWALALEEQGMADAALATLEKGIEAVPDSLTLAVAKAERLNRRGELDKAIATYQALLDVDGQSDVAANNLASLLTKRAAAGDYELALRYAERFRRSRVPHFQDTLGWLYLQLGKHDDALYLLEQAAEDLAGLAEVRYHLGMAYYKLGRKPEALRELGIARDALKSGQGFANLSEIESLLTGLQQE